MTVQGIGMQQQLQSSVLMHEHFPAWGLTTEPAALETELDEAGIVLIRMRARARLLVVRNNVFSVVCGEGLARNGEELGR